MPHAPSPLAQNILDLAINAGKILLKYYKTNINVEFKRGEFDPVTIADKEADAFIRSSLEKSFPEDFILSEENAAMPEHYGGRVWMVDPLDGTRYFIQGKDNFSVLISLVENGNPILGVLYLPAQNKIYYGEKGKGAYRKIGSFPFEKIVTLKEENIEEAKLITRYGSEFVRPIEEKTNTIPFKERVEAGSLGVKLVMIAEGSADAHFDTSFMPCKWDAAAGQIIVEEAGGVVTDYDGNKIDYQGESVTLGRSVVTAGNHHLHNKIISEFRKLGL